ncbi:MAG: pantoate--beta-alanine ligase [Desulfobulbaceae bacterium]
MEIIHSPAEMTAWAEEQAGNGLTVGLVPTMGYFHEGHLRLMRAAGEFADRVVVSIFVNPIQFGPGEDFAAYPRDFDRDCRLAETEGVDVIFAPRAEDMYPEGYQTMVSVGGITRGLCGRNRPGHFDGVATVVVKLFNITRADLAVFGEKDFQQLAVIRRMVRDLNMGIRIIGHPIVREKDGLAMSSRNTYLQGEERQVALCLWESLNIAREMAGAGILDTVALTEAVSEHILSRPGTVIDYISFVDSRALEPVDRVDSDTILALAVRINDRVRLIDNGFVLLNENGASPAGTGERSR